jgi:hypothetical protein
MEGLTMGVKITTDFLDLLKQKQMNVAHFEPYLQQGVKIHVHMYMLLAADSSGEVIAKVSSQKAVQNNLPTMAAELLTKLKQWASNPSFATQKEAEKKLAYAALYGISAKQLKKSMYKPMPDAVTVTTMGAGSPVDQFMAAEAAEGAAPAMSLLTGAVAAIPAPMHPSVSPVKTDYPVLDPKQPVATVHLRDACGLYRRVKGTDEHSVYFLLADFGDLKMAGRWKGNAFSVRFESPNMKKYSPYLKDMGLKSTPSHASVHVTVANAVEARKLVGAMIGAIGAAPLSPLPNVDMIIGVGA